ncbi:MAG: hypothetical protein RR512_08855, partial [Coprobacillus sp.]
EINKGALEQTKQACHEELDSIQKKYNMNHYQRIYVYIKTEYHSLFVYSLMALSFVFGCMYFLRDFAISYMMIYFLLLGSIVMIGYIKNDIYDLNDVLGVVYINEGREFLYRSIIVTVFQLLSFGCLSILTSQNDFSYILLVTLIPIFISQTIALHFIHYVSNSFMALIIYLSIYLSIVIFAEMNKYYMFFQLKGIYFVTIVSLVIYLFNLFILYKQRKGKREYGINY